MISDASAPAFPSGNARGQVFASSARAYRSHAAGLSRISISTSAPVAIRSRMRESRHMMPTFSTPSAGQYTA